MIEAPRCIVDCEWHGLVPTCAVYTKSDWARETRGGRSFGDGTLFGNGSPKLSRWTQTTLQVLSAREKVKNETHDRDTRRCDGRGIGHAMPTEREVRCVSSRTVPFKVRFANCAETRVKRGTRTVELCTLYTSFCPIVLSQ